MAVGSEKKFQVAQIVTVAGTLSVIGTSLIYGQEPGPAVVPTNVTQLAVPITIFFTGLGTAGAIMLGIGRIMMGVNSRLDTISIGQSHTTKELENVKADLEQQAASSRKLEMDFALLKQSIELGRTQDRSHHGNNHTHPPRGG